MNTQVDNSILEGSLEEYAQVHSNGVNHHENNHGAHPDVHIHTKVDLRSMFPVSMRYPLRQSLGMIGLFILLAVPALRYVGIHALLYPSAPAEFMCRGILVIALMATLLKYFYEELHRQVLAYETDGFRLVVTRGIIFRKEVSLPLLPVTEIYVDRDVLDFFLGLYDLNVATPVTGSRAFGLIHGLSFKNAHAMEDFLSLQLNRQIFTVDNPPPMN